MQEILKKPTLIETNPDALCRATEYILVSHYKYVLVTVIFDLGCVLVYTQLGMGIQRHKSWCLRSTKANDSPLDEHFVNHRPYS